MMVTLAHGSCLTIGEERASINNRFGIKKNNKETIFGHENDKKKWRQNRNCSLGPGHIQHRVWRWCLFVTAGADGNWWGEKQGEGGVVCLRVRGERLGGRVTLPLLKEVSSGRVSVRGPPSSHNSPTDHNLQEGRRLWMMKLITCSQFQHRHKLWTKLITYWLRNR